MTQRLQKLEVLHIPRADLDDVHLLEERQLRDVHDLGHDRQPGSLSGLQKQGDPVPAKPLEGVGRGARLERAAAQQSRARGLHRLGDAADLLSI